MIWRPTIYSLAPLIAAGVAAVLVGVAWRYRDRPIGVPFLAVVIGIFGWCLAHAIQLGFTTPETQLFWIAIAYTFAVTIPTSWFVLALVYSGREGLLNRRRLAVLACEPVVMALLLLTMPFHDLVFRYRDFRMVGGIEIAILEIGPAMYAHLAYGYLLIVAGLLLLVRVFVRASAVYRRQAALLVVGLAVALAANVVVTLGSNPLWPIDLTTIAFTVTGVVFGLALFGFDLLNLTPVAREQLIDEFGSGLIVVDDRNQVTHFNEVASRTLEDLERVGQDATVVFGVEDLDTIDGQVLSREIDGEARAYDLRVSSIEDYRNREVGSLIALRDVTDRRQYEQRLEVANRLLRHNLRNDMNKIAGWAELLERELLEGMKSAGRTRPRTERPAEDSFETERPAEDSFETERPGEESLDEVAVIETEAIVEAGTLSREIKAIAEEVADLGRKANQIETTLEVGRAELTTVSLDDVLVEVTHATRVMWPDGTVLLSMPHEMGVRAPSRELLETALKNLVENGFEHNDADDPEVEITARRIGDEVEIRIADNGPGIPEMERRVLQVGQETSLQHGSGLGLWLAKWVLQSANGELRFETNQPRGTVVVIRLRASGATDGPAESAPV